MGDCSAKPAGGSNRCEASTFKVSTQITFCNFRRGSGLSAKLAPGGSTVGTRLREVQCGFGVFRCWSQRPWVPAKVLGSDLVPVEVSFENFIENFGGKFSGKKIDKGNKPLRSPLTQPWFACVGWHRENRSLPHFHIFSVCFFHSIRNTLRRRWLSDS